MVEPRCISGETVGTVKSYVRLENLRMGLRTSEIAPLASNVKIFSEKSETDVPGAIPQRLRKSCLVMNHLT